MSDLCQCPVLEDGKRDLIARYLSMRWGLQGCGKLIIEDITILAGCGAVHKTYIAVYVLLCVYIEMTFFIQALLPEL